jgi:NAD(P)-dependent dehydrogenase (short-subunit alcohol dehydrogenase family)
MSPPTQDALDTVSTAVLERTFKVNTFGPLLLSQALLPNLSANPGSVVGIVSSRVGSVGDNSTGGSYAYRASKAAVNSIGKSMAMDLKDKGIAVSLLHPGIVNSSLNTWSGERHPESVMPDEAAGKLWKVFMSKGMQTFLREFGHALIQPPHNGRYRRYRQVLAPRRVRAAMVKSRQRHQVTYFTTNVLFDTLRTEHDIWPIRLGSSFLDIKVGNSTIDSELQHHRPPCARP